MRQPKAPFSFFPLSIFVVQDSCACPLPTPLLAIWAWPAGPSLTLFPALSLLLHTPFVSAQLNSLQLPRLPCSVPSTGNPFSPAPTAIFLNLPSIKTQIQRHLIKGAFPSPSLLATGPLALGQHCHSLLCSTVVCSFHSPSL